MEAFSKFVLPCIHIKKEKISEPEDESDRVPVMNHDIRVSCNAKQYMVPCQKLNHGNLKQNADGSHASEKVNRDEAEWNGCAEKGLSHTTNIPSISDPKILTFKRKYRKRIPKVKELSSLLSKPFEMNWRREVVFRAPGSSSTADAYYFTPDGKKLRSLPQVAAYLKESNETMLSLNSFTFRRGRISDSPHEIERFARIWKKKSQSPEKVDRVEAVSCVQDCSTNNHTQEGSGHEYRGRPDDSSWSTNVNNYIMPGSCLPSYQAWDEDNEHSTYHQWKQHDDQGHLPASHHTNAGCFPQDNPQVLPLSDACEGKSKDYLVKCDAPNCHEPYGLLVWVQCGNCDRWMHNVCIGLQSEETYPDRLHYKCNFCQLRGPKLSLN